MRKVLLVSLLALGVTGCVAPSAPPPQVRDLSVSRDNQPSDTVTVKAGDTLYGIAWRHSMDFRQLARLNNLMPPYRLQPGQTLRLDGGVPVTAIASRDMQGTSAEGVTTVQNPDWLAPDTEAIERNQGLTSRPLGGATSDTNVPSGEALAAAADAGAADAPGPVYDYDTPDAGTPSPAAPDSERTVASSGQTGMTPDTSVDTTVSSSPGDTAPSDAGQADAGTAVAGEPAAAPEPEQRTYTPVQDIPWQWPTEGQVVRRFDDESGITAGIDIAGQKGQPVRAAGPGIVVYAGDGVRGYGNLILLKHNDQFLSAYAHNDSLSVEVNDVVRAGEVIATMGNTDANGVKLHFEVRKDGQPVDPLEILPPR